jgi:hypothetical protein
MQYLREHNQVTLVATQVKQQRVKLVKLARQNDQYAYTRTDTRAFAMWACVEEIQVSNLVNKQAFETSSSMWAGIQERLTFNLNLLSTPERLQCQLCGCCVVYVGSSY